MPPTPKKEKPKKVEEDKIHSIFRLGALLVVGYLVYSFFVPDVVEQSSTSTLQCEKIAEEKVQAKVKEFVDYINENTNSKSPKLLRYNKGYMVYIPSELSGSQESLNVESEDLKIKIDMEKVDVK